jgi:tetrahydromethanopterin S-methyltransferase subunit B
MMYKRRSRSLWGWGVVVRIPGCVTQAIAGTLVLGLMILLALILTVFQAIQSIFPR